MKVWIENFNGVLDLVMDHYKALGQITDNYHEADVFVLWQDVRGHCLDIAGIAKRQLGKPVIVVQHGRGASRDYCRPNNFPLIADVICVWGEADRRRLLEAGVSDERIAVTGCPLFPMLKPRNRQRDGINVLFVPVIAQKEEPENILVYAALKIWESENLIKNIQADFHKYKKAWAVEITEYRDIIGQDGKTERRLWNRSVEPRILRNKTYARGLVNVKATGIHDIYQYQAPVVVTQQGDPDHARCVIDMLSNVDAMVCLEEGTMQLLAHAMGIPVIVADIYSYGNYGGTSNYDAVEKIKTKACYRTEDIRKIGRILDHALAHRLELAKACIDVCEQEAGASLGDATANVVKAINSVIERQRTGNLAAA